MLKFFNQHVFLEYLIYRKIYFHFIPRFIVVKMHNSLAPQLSIKVDFEYI
jgi:hypothetical protein